MEIKKENILRVLKTAPESVKEVILGLFPELKEETAQKADNRPITERVKTFDDACRELGEDHPTVVIFRQVVNPESEPLEPLLKNRDLVAFLKLRVICAALNEGWQPQFTETEERWFPWFTLWTEEELSEKSDEWKANRSLLMTGEQYQSDYAGLAFAASANAPSGTYAYFGSRLCLKSEALATYCGKQFISLWADFHLSRKA